MLTYVIDAKVCVQTDVRICVCVDVTLGIDRC